MNRRSFLRGVALAAPAVILTPGLLMPVRKLSTERSFVVFGETTIERMTATEVLELQRQALLRMANLMVFPPLDSMGQPLIYGTDAEKKFVYLIESWRARQDLNPRPPGS
jgi:hypothetical protein